MVSSISSTPFLIFWPTISCRFSRFSTEILATMSYTPSTMYASFTPSTSKIFLRAFSSSPALVFMRTKAIGKNFPPVYFIDGVLN